MKKILIDMYLFIFYKIEIINNSYVMTKRILPFIIISPIIITWSLLYTLGLSIIDYYEVFLFSYRSSRIEPIQKKTLSFRQRIYYKRNFYKYLTV